MRYLPILLALIAIPACASGYPRIANIWGTGPATINALASTAKAKSYSWKILPREADETPDESRGTAYTRPDGVRNASPPGEIVYYGHKDNPATTRDEREDPYTLFGDDSKKFGLGTGTSALTYLRYPPTVALEEVERIIRQLNAKQLAALMAAFPEERAALMSRRLLEPRTGREGGS